MRSIRFAALPALIFVAQPLRAEEIRVELRRGTAAVRLARVGRLTEGPDAAPLPARSAVKVGLRGGALRIGGRAARAPVVARPGAASVPPGGKAPAGRGAAWPAGR